MKNFGTENCADNNYTISIIIKTSRPALSNVILYLLFSYFSISLFCTIIVVPDLNLLAGFFLAQYIKHSQCKRLQFWSTNCFFFTANGSPLNFIPVLYPESFMLCKKAVYDGLSLEV